MSEHKLKSGNAVLKINNVPFAEADALNQAVMAELRVMKFTKEEIGDLMKNVFAAGRT